VAFLGDVTAADLESTKDAVRDAVVSWRASGSAKPRVRIAGAGRFGRGRFTTLWAGVDGDVAELRALADTARGQLKRARIPYDRKPFKPHLTLARPGDRMDAATVAADLAALGGYRGPQWTVDALTLVRSQLGAHPVHETVLEVALD
jgi:2'-5' RNA ligase